MRQAHRVVRDGLLDRLAHLRSGAEETVGGHQPRERLVRSLEVVRVDEERQAPHAIGEIREDRLAEKLVPERLPEALHLPQRLRVLRPALDVPDPFPPKLHLEFRRAPPRRVLPPLVGQDLLRRSVRGDPSSQRLHDQIALLVVGQRPAHHEAGVVVEEGRDVQALVPSQQKREDVRLPKLVGLRPLEAPLGVLARLASLCFGEQTLLVQHPPHLGLAHSQTLASRYLVAYAPRAVARVRTPCRRHRLPSRVLRVLPAFGWASTLRLESLRPAQVVGAQPAAHRGRAQPKHQRRLQDPHPVIENLPDHSQPERQRVRVAAASSLLSLIPTALTALCVPGFLSTSRHLSLLVNSRRGDGVMCFRSPSDA